MRVLQGGLSLYSRIKILILSTDLLRVNIKLEIVSKAVTRESQASCDASLLQSTHVSDRHASSTQPRPIPQEELITDKLTASIYLVAYAGLT